MLHTQAHIDSVAAVADVVLLAFGSVSNAQNEKGNHRHLYLFLLPFCRLLACRR